MPSERIRNRNLTVYADWWARLVSKVDFTGDCWEWRGAIGRQGYGNMMIRKRVYRVHNKVWERLVGPIPAGRVLDHLCRNHRCVNPDHLEPVTERVNILRGYSPPANAVRTGKCKRGHELDYIMPGTGHRGCTVCRREALRRSRERKKACHSLPTTAAA